jgi:hypothetical protein
MRPSKVTFAAYERIYARIAAPNPLPRMASVQSGIEATPEHPAPQHAFGEDLAAAPGQEPGEGLGLDADHGREDSVTFTILIDSTIVNVTAHAGQVEVERQHPPGSRAGIEYRHRARLGRRIG